MPPDLLVALKPVHVALAAASGAGFAVRGAWMLSGSPRLDSRWVRIAPHVLDTFLLASGLALAIGLGISPGETPWLAAKLAALVVYVVLGAIALRRGRARAIRIGALVLALAAFGYVVAAALAKSPLPLAS